MAAENGAKTHYQAVLQYQRCQMFHISLHFLAERSGDGLVVFSKYPSVFYNAMMATIQYNSNIFEKLHFICYRINDT